MPEPIPDLLDRDRFRDWLRSGPTDTWVQPRETRPAQYDCTTELANPIARYLQAHGYPGASVSHDTAYETFPRPSEPEPIATPLPAWATAALSAWRAQENEIRRKGGTYLNIVQVLLSFNGLSAA